MFGNRCNMCHPTCMPMQQTCQMPMHHYMKPSSSHMMPMYHQPVMPKKEMPKVMPQQPMMQQPMMQQPCPMPAPVCPPPCPPQPCCEPPKVCMAPAVMHPCKHQEVHTYETTVVPHVYPSHTCYVHHHVTQLQNHYPHTVSHQQECCTVEQNCGC